jgi:rhodanese-related sulfurtransferase
MSYQSAAGYAGDLLATDAYHLLASEPAATLIDVRTQPEWVYVGAPDLRPLGKNVLFLEWQSFPSMAVDPHFAQRLGAMLEGAGVPSGAPLVFLCRSGARSRQAAVTMTTAGFGPCFNVADGFEGPLDSAGHRSALGGWKAGGLPWRQT